MRIKNPHQSPYGWWGCLMRATHTIVVRDPGGLCAPHTTHRTTCQALDDGPTDSPPSEKLGQSATWNVPDSDKQRSHWSGGKYVLLVSIQTKCSSSKVDVNTQQDKTRRHILRACGSAHRQRLPKSLNARKAISLVLYRSTWQN